MSAVTEYLNEFQLNRTLNFRSNIVNALLDRLFQCHVLI